MSRFVEKWDDLFARNQAAQPGIDAWFIHSPQRPSRMAPDAALTFSTVLLSPATDAASRAAWQALRGAFVFARVEHVRFEGANAVGALEYCLQDLPQITQAIVHAPDDRHDEIISQIGSVLSRVGALLSVLVTRHDGPFVPGTFHGCIREEEGALARTALSALMMFQGLDAAVDMVCLDVEDVRSVLGEAASGVRLVEALWLPADKKLVFCDARDIDPVATAHALWVSIDAWATSVQETREIWTAYPIKTASGDLRREIVFNAPSHQWYTTALGGPLTRVRILYR
mgnify:CR=1 FL=1|jgi:hypothetical protein